MVVILTPIVLMVVGIPGYIYTTWKVDGATPMYCFIMAPYYLLGVASHLLSRKGVCILYTWNPLMTLMTLFLGWNKKPVVFFSGFFPIKNRGQLWDLDTYIYPYLYVFILFPRDPITEPENGNGA